MGFIRPNYGSLKVSCGTLAKHINIHWQYRKGISREGLGKKPRNSMLGYNYRKRRLFINGNLPTTKHLKKMIIRLLKRHQKQEITGSLNDPGN